MIAKLMKMVAAKSVRVRSTRSGQIRIYWDVDGTRKFTDIDGHSTLDLLTVMPIESIRRNEQIASLLHAGHLVEAPLADV